jgi:hypothetical protein
VATSRASAAVTDRYRDRLVTLRDRARAEAARAWGEIDPDRIDDSYRPGLLAPVVAALQREAARTAGGYLKAFVETELGRSVRTPPVDASRTGRSRSGDSLRAALDAPTIVAKVAISDGLTVADALRRGGQRLDLIVGLAVDTAARDALYAAMVASPYVVGWRRAVGGTCSACTGSLAREGVSSTTPLGTVMKQHPNCKCVPEPVVGRRWKFRDNEARPPRPEGVGPARPGWQDALTEEQVEALNDYTLGGYSINDALAAGYLSAEEQRAFRLIDDAIKKAGRYADDERPIVYRGVRVTDEMVGQPGVHLDDDLIADWAEKEFKPGKIIEPKGFQSTTGRPRVALSHRGQWGGFLYEILARSGAVLDGPLTAFYRERELLQAAGTRYRVRGVVRRAKFKGEPEKDDEFVTVVQLEEI